MTAVFECGWPVVSALVMLSISLHSAAASCNEEQIRKCSEAAVDNKLGTLEAGGVCEENQYVAFTHLCTVSDYRPNVDFCCCAYQQKALCCRYHQDWSRFRCTESEDTVDVLSRQGLPLHILLPAILGPIGLLLFCLFCCIRCHCRNDEDDEKTRWYCWCYKRKGDKSELSDSPSSSASGRGHMISAYQNTRPGTAERRPLHSFHSNPGGKVPLTDIPEGQRLMAMPSAPPLDDEECPFVFPHQLGAPGGSASDAMPQCPPYCPHVHGHHHHHHQNHSHHPGGCMCSSGGGSGETGFGDSPQGHAPCPHQFHQMHPGPCCFVQQTSVHSCSGCGCSRQNSAVTQGSTCSGEAAPQAPSPTEQREADSESPPQETADSSASSPSGSGHNPTPTPRTVCPSCSSNGGLPPPPAYEESWGHRIIN